eukprot:TRINITY_DN12665_c0_g1_i1.p1 TRINITY_DN12665_c0_g1~~TRINITY_DN12665_c0_g1_i1.p1  ORF type:complete len:307 (-),score=32.99 TRINITY_DN12665_c0_g1_i1:222-1142(-)
MPFTIAYLLLVMGTVTFGFRDHPWFYVPMNFVCWIAFLVFTVVVIWREDERTVSFYCRFQATHLDLTQVTDFDCLSNIFSFTDGTTTRPTGVMCARQEQIISKLHRLCKGGPHWTQNFHLRNFPRSNSLREPSTCRVSCLPAFCQSRSPNTLCLDKLKLLLVGRTFHILFESILLLITYVILRFFFEWIFMHVVAKISLVALIVLRILCQKFWTELILSCDLNVLFVKTRYLFWSITKSIDDIECILVQPDYDHDGNVDLGGNGNDDDNDDITDGSGGDTAFYRYSSKMLIIQCKHDVLLVFFLQS